MNVVSWGAEIFGGRPHSVGDEEPVINKLGYKLEACDWLPQYEPYKLRADHPYYGNRAEPINDELAELRAFKEAAIARFPELAPVDPDLLEAREICAKNVDSHNPLMIEPYRNGEYDHHWLVRCVKEGIDRGRELERYAQGLTTPKD